MLQAFESLAVLCGLMEITIAIIEHVAIILALHG